MDKSKFKNSKAKPLSEEKILSILEKAYPVDSDDDDEEEKPKKNKKGKGKNKDKKKKLCPDCGEPLDECICDEEDDDDDNELDYEEMSTKELYKLCKERDIEAKPKKKASYYIDLLEAADNAEYDEDEEDEEDEW